jgi:APA family basic amino acid/polyamine antiporter
MDNPQHSLHRYLGLPLATFYGLGTIVGAGIYVLIAEVALVSGSSLPLAFLLAGLAAALTGACYAELCSRYPRAAGAVLYVDEAFGRAWLSQLTGVLVLLTGIVSAAAISRGFVGYLDVYLPLPLWCGILMLCLLMGAIATAGIRESAWLITIITLLEVLGLLFVVALVWTGEPVESQPTQDVELSGILLGTFIAFYAFIGFEDLVNLAEETRDPERTLPLAILISVTVSLVLYVLVAFSAVRFVELDDLGQSASPLVLMVSGHPGAMQVITLVGIVAISNGALTQVVMASRMLYGMATRSLLPSFFSYINPRTRTPVRNVWIVVALIAAMALWLPLVTLAKLTSAIILVLFALVNLSLMRIRGRAETGAAFTVWFWVPGLGLLVNLALLGWQLLGL